MLFVAFQQSKALAFVVGLYITYSATTPDTGAVPVSTPPAPVVARLTVRLRLFSRYCVPPMAVSVISSSAVHVAVELAVATVIAAFFEYPTRPVRPVPKPTFDMSIYLCNVARINHMKLFSIIQTS